MPHTLPQELTPQNEGEHAELALQRLQSGEKVFTSQQADIVLQRVQQEDAVTDEHIQRILGDVHANVAP